MLRIRWSGPPVVTATGAMRSTRVRILRTSLLGALAATIPLAFAAGTALPASALATPTALDAPDNGEPPLVAYAPSDGYTYVAWSAPLSQGGTGVDLCIVPPGAASCMGGAPALLLDPVPEMSNSSNTVSLAGLVILPTSNEIVVLGMPVSTGTVAWASPAGGSAFLTGSGGLQNLGNLISPVSLYYTPNNAVALSGTDVGLFDSYDHEFSYFSDSPFAGPETPATLPLITGNANNGGQFDDQHDTIGPVLAAEPAPAPAPTGTDLVVGVGANHNSNQPTPTGCVNYAATGYGVTAGTTGSSGTLNTHGLQPSGFSLLACSAEDPVLASGGTAGIGELAQEGSGVSGAGSTYTLDYRPFIATATGGTFGSPVQLQDDTSTSLGGAINLDLADDSGTGVYASWEDNQGLVLDYSPNGGATWDGPMVVPQLSNGASQGYPTIAGVGGGIVEVAYAANPGTGEQVFLQAVDLIPPTPTPTPTAVTVTTSQTSGTTAGANISVPAGTVGETDQAILTGTHAATATGTIAYGLYDNSSCTGSAVSTSSESVTAGKPAASAPVTAALAPGTYYWKAAYSGDAANDAGTSACGSEVLTVTPAAEGPKVGEGATSTSTTVTVTITCAGPCTVTLTLTIPTASAARKGKKKPKPLILAKGTFTLPKGGTHKLTLHLTKTGRKIFAARHGRLTASLLLSQKIDGHTISSTKTIKITPAKPKHKHKK